MRLRSKGEALAMKLGPLCLAALVALGAAAGPALRPAAADTLAEIKAGGALVWGADQEGGGPYVYPRDDDKSQVTGFEVDLAAALAEALGVRARFQQGPWDQMPALLEAKKVHIVLNGYEWSPARAAAMEATIPYYVYGLQFMARADDDGLKSLDDLAKPGPNGKRRIGVLGGSASEDYVKQRWGDAVVVVSFDGNTEAMGDVSIGRLDATVADTPTAAFYLPKFAKLRKLGPPVGKGFYVVYARKGDAALVAALNAALIRLYRAGTLEAIYRRYGIWDENQAELAALIEAGKFYGYAKDVLAEPAKPGAAPGAAKPEEPARSAVPGFLDSLWILVQAAAMTVILTVLAFPLAMALGLGVAIGRVHGPNWLKPALTVYVEFLRGTPVMLQLFFIFYFLPLVGVNIPAFWCAILGLAVNYSAYESEIYRAALMAVPKGQMEGGMALGLSRAGALRHVVVPQATRFAIPPSINDFIAMFKDTSVCSVITVVELTKQFTILSRSDPAAIAWLMAATAALYILMSYPTSLAARRLEKRLARPYGAAAPAAVARPGAAT
jgi:polar amino acid transport system substrate-binding protein